MSDVLKKWLTHQTRDPCPYAQFAVYDATELVAPDVEIKAYISDTLRDETHDPQFLKDAADFFGWDRVRHLIQAGLPTQASARRGEFGEAIAGLIVSVLVGFHIPVRKLRYKISASQSLPRTDVLGIRLDDRGEIDAVCIVESKLRTGADTSYAVSGYKQLHEEVENTLNDILLFVAERLYERSDTLYGPFMRYLRDRSPGVVREDCRLFLTHDARSWNERTLSNLDDESIQLNPLSVHVVLVEDLSALTDELFANIGVEVLIDDDD